MSEDYDQYKKMGRSAFVIGYTGECGKELVNALSKTKIFNKVVLIGRRKVDLNPDPGPEFEQKVVDYDKLEDHTDAFEGANVGYCCLGTTRGKAGKEGFIKVDRDYVLKSAELAKAAGCQHFSVVTASMADKNSMILYTKTKGETEEGLKQMSFEKLSIFKPALLLCERAERRLGEKIFMGLCTPMAYLFPTFGSVPTAYVGKAMVRDTVIPGEEKLRLYPNAAIHKLAKEA